MVRITVVFFACWISFAVTEISEPWRAPHTHLQCRHRGYPLGACHEDLSRINIGICKNLKCADVANGRIIKIATLPPKKGTRCGPSHFCDKLRCKKFKADLLPLNNVPPIGVPCPSEVKIYDFRREKKNNFQ